MKGEKLSFMKNKKLLFIPAFACALLLSTGLKANNLVAAKAEGELVTDVVFSSKTFSYVEGTTGHFTTCDHNSRWWGTRSFFIPEGIPFYRSVDDYDLNEANEHINTADSHTAKLELKNSVLQTERYLTFYMGGGLNEEKLYVEVIDKGTDGTSEATRIDKLTMKDLFNDPKSGETLFLRVVDLNEYLGHYITVRVVDNEPGGWGCFNFGGLKFNQTEKNVRDTLYQYLKNAYETQTDADKDAGQYPYIRQRVNEFAEYSLFKPTSWQSFESLDFESITLKDYFTDMSSATLTDVMWNNLISSADFYDWNEHMPFNKHGRKFFSTHPGWTGISEDVKVLLKSNFTVTIDKPYMAFRIASAKANIQLLDATNDEVLYDFNPAGNVNPFFKDTGVGNVITAKSTNCTMTEAFVDVSKLIGRTVKLTIGENATGGGWGLSFIDEIRFNLSVSDIKVDLTDNVIAQQVKDVKETYHGVVLPRYLRGNSSVSEENDSVLTAFNFLGEFYATLREYNGTSMCQLSNEAKLALVNKYNAITDEVALSIINTADDFNYNNNANPGNEYYVKDVVVTKEGVAQTMAYLISTTSTNSLLSSLNVRFIANSNTLAFFFSVIAVVLISVVSVLFVRRRHLNK